MRASVIAVVVAGCTASRSAAATYSIVAADTSTREVGGAGTSCLRGGDVYRIYGSVPGVGAVHAQATWNQAGLERALELLQNGFAPREILDQLAAPEFDAQASTRQYGIVDVTGRVAGFSGEDNRSSAADRQGEAAGMHYSAQGNILTSEQVLARMAEAFEGAGCDLAERLLLALEAGAADGEGDSRCTASRGIPSDSAYLQVDRPDEPRGSYLELRVPTSGDANPTLALRENFETWRASHPCPSVGGAGGSGGSGMAGRAGEAGRGATVPAETPRAEEGCSCRTSVASVPALGWWIGLLFVALGVRRAEKA
jgi:uncharacterized Ntn-hydrolase superfamily protein